MRTVICNFSKSMKNHIIFLSTSFTFQCGNTGSSVQCVLNDDIFTISGVGEMMNFFKFNERSVNSIFSLDFGYNFNSLL